MTKDINFIKYFISNTLLLTTSNTLQFLLALYVLNETGSATLFSVMLSIVIIPRLLISPFAGAWGDKYNRKKLMQIYFIFYCFVYFSFGLLLSFMEDYHISIIFGICYSYRGYRDIIYKCKQ